MINIQNVSYQYGKRSVLSDVSFTVHKGEIFGLLGPNGSGKTTLFRILSTLLPLQAGSVSLLGMDLKSAINHIRKRIGVVFQSPSLDLKLTARENLLHQGHLYGFSGKALHLRIEKLLSQFSLSDRAKDLTQTFSGGMRRRLEIAKGLLHDPELLILDEPSTGLDPGARIDLWQCLKRLKNEAKMTVILTTHLMEEADLCDRLGILNQGKLVALDSPFHLKAEISGDVILAETKDPSRLLPLIQEKIDPSASLVDGLLKIACSTADAPIRITQIMQAFESDIQTITLRKPSLEDVFMQKTGHLFWNNSGV